MSIDINTILSALGNPAVTMIGGTLLGFGFSLLIKSNPGAATAVDHLADYNAALIEAVDGAEQTGFIGARKLSVALTAMEKWLADNGFNGNARDVTMERVRTDIELVRSALFPSKAA
jgi:hypothetical protein